MSPYISYFNPISYNFNAFEVSLTLEMYSKVFKRAYITWLY